MHLVEHTLNSYCSGPAFYYFKKEFYNFSNLNNMAIFQFEKQ